MQLSSQRTEAGARAFFRSLQGKYAAQLGDKRPIISKVKLGADGTYYRVAVGPFVTFNEANELCLGLKAVGAQCFVRRD